MAWNDVYKDDELDDRQRALAKILSPVPAQDLVLRPMANYRGQQSISVQSPAQGGDIPMRPMQSSDVPARIIPTTDYSKIPLRAPVVSVGVDSTPAPVPQPVRPIASTQAPLTRYSEFRAAMSPAMAYRSQQARSTQMPLRTAPVENGGDMPPMPMTGPVGNGNGVPVPPGLQDVPAQSSYTGLPSAISPMRQYRMMQMLQTSTPAVQNQIPASGNIASPSLQAVQSQLPLGVPARRATLPMHRRMSELVTIPPVTQQLRVPYQGQQYQGATQSPMVTAGVGNMTGVSVPPDDAITTSQDAPYPARPDINPDPNGSLRPGGSNPEAQPGALANALPALAPVSVTGPQSLQPAQPQLTPASASGLKPARKHGWADTLGSILVPGAMEMIPGSSLGEQRLALIAQQRAAAAADINNTNQLSAQRAAKAQQDLADAQRDALRKPTAKEAELYNLDPDAQYRPTELGRLAIEANKGAKPDSIQAMYASAVKDALDRGVDPMKDPRVQSLADAQTSLQKPTATRGEQRDDRAIEILSKPPAARTAEENSYLGGYQQWNKMRNVDPGMARMSVLLQQPIAAADPNNPGSEVYVSKKNAIGMGAPGGVNTTAPKALVKDFTSGADAKTLANINTADAHIQQLRGISQALRNGDVRVLNQLGNYFAQQTGSAAPTNFQLLKTALAAEIGKTTSGGVATNEETKEITKAINAANSPEQLNGVFDAATQLMHSKRDVLRQQYEQGKSGRPNFGQSKRDPNMIYARDPNGLLHASPKNGAKPLPPGWTYDIQPEGGR